MRNMKILILFVSLNALLSSCLGKNPPHIIFIVADDLGWHDVGWHNPEMHTPNLDSLARRGVILDSSYVHKVCTPSRSSFMTGYYPFHTGLQHGVIKPFRASALPEQFETLPTKLKALGYSTHIVGKWHLGYCNWKYTPTYRGFDSFFGYYSGSQNYFNHTCEGNRHDFRFNQAVYYPNNKTYSAKLFSDRAIDIINKADPDSQPLYLYIAFQSVHDPLQVPESYKQYYPDVHREIRKTYCGMVSALDEAVGKIKDALVSRGLMDNTLIVFTTDNGGKFEKGGNNYPLRGNKGSLWEGGTRGVAFVYSPTLLKKFGYVNTEMIHAVDWFPTLLHVAGGKPAFNDRYKIPDLKIVDTSMDGVNQWKTISENYKSSREGFVYGIDYVTKKWAIRYQNYKLLFGESGYWYNYKDRLMLFDLEKDPQEKEDIAEMHIDILEALKHRFSLYNDTQVLTSFARNRLLANPFTFNRYVLSPGWC